MLFRIGARLAPNSTEADAAIDGCEPTLNAPGPAFSTPLSPSPATPLGRLPPLCYPYFTRILHVFYIFLPCAFPPRTRASPLPQQLPPIPLQIPSKSPSNPLNPLITSESSGPS